jgi:hypothetical protein
MYYNVIIMHNLLYIFQDDRSRLIVLLFRKKVDRIHLFNKNEKK